MHSVLNITLRIYIQFTYQKTLLHTFSCLFLKSWKALSVSLNQNLFYQPFERLHYEIIPQLPRRKSLHFKCMFYFCCGIELTT